MSWLNFPWISVVLLAYVIGSIPFAYIAGRLLKGKDIRLEGDRNPGAGNAYQTIGPRAGLAVGFLDVGKGAAAVLLAKVIAGDTGAEMAAGVAAVVGHNWPIFLQLRGGRGAASAVGVFFALLPLVAIPLGIVGLAVLKTARSITVAVGLFMITLPLLAYFTGASPYLVGYSVGLPVMVGLRHYQTTRGLQAPLEDPAGEQALPQG